MKPSQGLQRPNDISLLRRYSLPVCRQPGNTLVLIRALHQVGLFFYRYHVQIEELLNATGQHKYAPVYLSPTNRHR